MSLSTWDFFRYELRPRHAIGAVATAAPRGGSLLRLQFSDGLIGYADVFPWSEYGDADILTQLRDFRDDRPSFLVQRSLDLGRRDAEARSIGKHLLEGRPALSHHYLISDCNEMTTPQLLAIRQQGFRSVKLKCGRDLQNEARFGRELMTTFGFRLRLDFNSRATPESFAAFLDYFSKDEVSQIEFIEDPFRYDLKLWSEFNRRVPLAMDHELEKLSGEDLVDASKSPFAVVILKPARQNITAIVSSLPSHLKLVFTNSLDHSVGQMHAWSVAAEYQELYPERCLEMGGLIEQVYQPDSFSSQVRREGNRLLPVPKTGVGFDELLSSLPWSSLREIL